MKLSTILLGGVAVLGLSSAAFAADLIVESPVAPTVLSSGTDWSGFYAGLNVGYGAGTLEVTNLPIDEEDVNGFFGGAQIGYNFQSGNLVFGIQSDIALSGILNDDEDPSDSIDWFGSTTGRVGVALDTVLPYVKAGVAYAAGTGHDGGNDDTQTSVGWTAGVGVELAVAENISVFGEYDYYDFGTATFNFGGPDVDVDTTLHAVKVGVNFGF